MNTKNWLERTSVRDFDKNHTMNDEDIKKITDVINNAPSSTNTQQFTAIIITNQEDKDFISKKNWGQQHISDSSAFILFLGDRSRVNKAKAMGDVNQTEISSKHEFARVFIDGTIGLTYAMTALVEMGYGTTVVGGVNGFADELAERFNLPDDMIVIAGLSVGKAIKTNPVKPNMNKVYVNEFNLEDHFKEMERYDADTKEEFGQRGTAPWIKATQVMASDNSSYTPAFNKAGEYIDKKYKGIK